ncbi:MAG: RNA polymerase sporulation sigma factor SigK [Firmicutes bacterium]|nr:RNA polymerase sporulation sigma factor SigK [Bacillota bacterium]
MTLTRPAPIFYLHNSVFPPQLTAAEEAECISALCRGEEDARARLIESNLRLVAHVAKKYESSGVDRDDLLSIGTIGLVKAISTFKCGKGARLATYAARCIENEILMHLRSIRHQRTEVSLQDPVGTDKEGNDVTLEEIIGSREATVAEEVEAEDDRRALLSSLPLLDEQESFIIRLRYGLNRDGERRTQRQVASLLGISRSYVSRLEKKAIEKLRKAVNGEA